MNFSILILLINLLFCECFTARRKRAAVSSVDRIWPNKTIPYTISNFFGDGIIKKIKESMAVWEKNTCLKFIDCNKKCDEFDNFVFFVPESGVCGSKVGRMSHSRIQNVYLDEKGCNYYHILLHEIGHLLGFFHEHSRPDRDNHIKVLNENIDSDYIDQFDKNPESEINTKILLPYDYESIMHYERNAFSDNGKDTIEFLDDNVDINMIGYYEKLSKSNINETLSLYNCTENEIKIDNIYKIEKNFSKFVFTFFKNNIPKMTKDIRSNLNFFTKLTGKSLVKPIEGLRSFMTKFF